MVAGQSYGGLAVLEAALRSDLPLDCAVAQSPSLWWGGEHRGVGEGTLMGDLRAGSVRPRRDCSGHDVAWWREGIVRSLDGWCAFSY